MTKRILVGMVAAVIAVGLAWGHAAEDRLLLRYKWHAGEQAAWLLGGEVTGSTVTRDMTQEPPSERSDGGSFTIESVIYQTTDAVTEEGTATVTYQIGTVDMEAQLDDGSKHYIPVQGQEGRLLIDGAEEPGADPVTAALLQLTAMVLSSRGELLPPARPLNLDELIMGACSTAGCLQIMRGSQVVLPEPRIGVGYAWAHTAEVLLKPEAHSAEAAGEDAGAAHRMTLTVVYTLAGLETVEGVQCAKIEMAGALDLAQSLSTSRPQPHSASTRMTGALHESVHAIVHFDLEAGHVLKAEADTILHLRRDVFGQMTEGDQTRQAKAQESFDDSRAHTTVAWVEPG
jgi:hypothetical protein